MDNSPHALHCDASGFDDGGAPRKARKPRARRKAAPARPAEDGALTVRVAVVEREAAEASRTEHAPAVHGTLELPAGVATDAPAPAHAAETPADAPIPADAVHQRIGQLTRTLHDALRELGYDKELQGTRDQLPDARDRLAYIARVTGEAAEKVLNAVDRARSVQEQMTQRARSLRTRWQAVAAYAANGTDRATPAGRALLEETCAFFEGVGSQTDATNAILTDIMLAQDFHDLTGQVIRRVVALATSMEEQLLKLLLETTPPEQRRRIETERTPAPAERLDGPVVNASGRDDVVTDQAAVDDLLASLGF